MTEDIVQPLINGVAVTAGLYILWSFIGRMADTPRSVRFQFALLAGVLSALVHFVVRLFF